MSSKKIIALTFLPLLVTSFLLSQSLVDVAKKEKERRENLKDKKRVVVTNSDLVKLKKKPSLSTPEPEVMVEPRAEVKEEETEEKGEGAEVPEEVAPRGVELLEPEGTPKKNFEELKVELEEKWSKATEYAELYELKMNGLWQKFYALDDMTSRDSIQREISETYTKLLKAQEDAAKAKEELDKLLASRKEASPSIWIR